MIIAPRRDEPITDKSGRASLRLNEYLEANADDLNRIVPIVDGLGSVPSAGNFGFLTETTHDALPSDNPHGVTAAQAGADPVGTASSAVSAHEAAGDPHSQYLTEVEHDALPSDNPHSVTLAQVGGTTDHGSLGGLSDDDHPQYAFLAGRSGGQSLFGGTLAADNLDLAASPIPGTGRINANSPIVFGSYQASGAAYGFSYTATEVFTGAFIGGGLNFSGTISMNNGVFIYESFRGSPQITTNAPPGFAAYTVLQALPLLIAGSVSTHNPLAPLVLNSGPTVRNPFAGSRTTGTLACINWAGQVQATVAFASMNLGAHTGMSAKPTYATSHALASVDFGNIRTVWSQVPGVALFQLGLGPATADAIIGLEFDNMAAFGGAIPKVAVRSFQNAATDSFVIQGLGTAASQLRGQLFFPLDLVGLTFGASNDTNMGWGGAGFFFQSFAVGQQYRISAGTNFTRMTNDNDSELQLGFGDVTVEGNLDSQGRFRAKTTRVTTTYTVLVTDHIVLGNTDAGGYAATLPAGTQNHCLRVVNTGTSGNNLTIMPDGSDELIGLNSSFTLSDGEAINIVYDATDGWY